MKRQEIPLFSFSPLPIFFVHSASATPASRLFLQYFCTLTPAAGLVLYPLLRMPAPLVCRAHSLLSPEGPLTHPSPMGLPWTSAAHHHPCLFILLFSRFLLITYHFLTQYILIGLYTGTLLTDSRNAWVVCIIVKPIIVTYELLIIHA